MSGVPLARLFALAYTDLVEQLHARLDARGWHDVRRPYGFVLLALRDRESTVTELARILRVSKQATSKLVDAMADAGYVDRRGGAADGRRRVVCLAPRGRELLGVVEEIYAELENEWASLVGPGDLETVRDTLARALELRHGGALPPVRAP